MSLRHDLEQIADDPVVRHLEDRRVLVLVDRDDRLGRAHPRQVLDRARDPDGDVQIGAHHPPGLSDLIGGRTPAVIRDGARGAHGRVAEGGRQILDQLEVLGGTQASASAHDDRRLAQVQLGRRLLRELGHDHACGGGIGGGATASTRAVRGCSAGGIAPGRSDTIAGVPVSRSVTLTLPV